MFDIIKQHDSSLELERKCSALGVSVKGYSKWLRRKAPKPDPLEMKLRNEIQKLAADFPRYGYRRMTAELHRRGFPVNHKRVLGLMRGDNLLCVKRIFKPVTTDSNHNFPVYPNLAKGLEVTRINQLWVADITYIRLLTEFVYLAAIIDVFSRKCLGWELDRYMDTQLTLNALDIALLNRKGMDLSELIHHSDQGSQYAANEYVERLKENEIRISMGRKGNPYDNAFMESFIKTLKWDEVYLNEYATLNEARENIGPFIEKVYNAKRLHSSIGYKPPNEFEKEVKQ